MGRHYLCRHCNTKFANRPRRLCWGCYNLPGVRDLYPSTSKFATGAARGEKGDSVELPTERFNWRRETPTFQAKVDLPPEAGLLIARAEYDNRDRRDGRYSRRSQRTREKMYWFYRRRFLSQE